MTADTYDVDIKSGTGARLAHVRADMAQAAAEAGRAADDVCLLAGVSKTKPVEQIEAFIALGQRHFAEKPRAGGDGKMARLESGSY